MIYELKIINIFNSFQIEILNISEKFPKNMAHFITLRNIDNNVIDQRFGLGSDNGNNHKQGWATGDFSFTPLTVGTNLSSNQFSGTSVHELMRDNTQEIVSFLDDSKRTVNCHVSMIDYNRHKNYLSSRRYHCFWCRHDIQTIPIGCPIDYIPDQVVKTYYSELSKDVYIIKENIPKSNLKHIENINDPTLFVNKKGYYITDGTFCSFNCCAAYIVDQKRENLYSNSKTLLLKMYMDLTGNDIDKIEPASHWKTLTAYGGFLGIDEFRNSFGRVEYRNHGTIINKMPIGVLFEEKLKL